MKSCKMHVETMRTSAFAWTRAFCSEVIMSFIICVMSKIGWDKITPYTGRENLPDLPGQNYACMRLGI